LEAIVSSVVEGREREQWRTLADDVCDGDVLLGGFSLLINVLLDL
jgi:hypothetical protein